MVAGKITRARLKTVLFAALLLGTVSGCTTAKVEEQHVDKDITQLQQQQDALSAAIAKIQVAFSPKMKGYAQTTTLGPAQGYCFNLPNSTGGQVVHGDSLRAAAYRKYGNQVDAIVGTSIWFVPDDAFGPYEPYTENGYFECSGTAVHFASESSPTDATNR